MTTENNKISAEKNDQHDVADQLHTFPSRIKRPILPRLRLALSVISFPLVCGDRLLTIQACANVLLACPLLIVLLKQQHTYISLFLFPISQLFRADLCAFQSQSKRVCMRTRTLAELMVCIRSVEFRCVLIRCRLDDNRSASPVPI